MRAGELFCAESGFWKGRVECLLRVTYLEQDQQLLKFCVWLAVRHTSKSQSEGRSESSNEDLSSSWHQVIFWELEPAQKDRAKQGLFIPPLQIIEPIFFPLSLKET